MENLNPVTDGSGETFWMPFNMQDSSLLAKQSQHAQKALKAGDQEAVLPGMQKTEPTPVPQLPAPKDTTTKPAKKRSADGEDEETSLYGLRHGETALNADNKYRGWSTAPLDESGKAQIVKAAAFLKDKGITRIFSSDLVRARESAALVAVEL